ncbi:unnamed protein product [Caenorhabditis auriculariae]|uniref:S-formylglutathione hydrolase n=1 Tax=Caenorhabditis auriculariae TaxID=2777116 RepID=A0A8S1H5Z2_9PELO|nr:unnamed protein product [Caenorhabditis auriculariae]
MTAEVVTKVRSFKGFQYVYRHASTSLKCDMTFGVYVPDHSDSEKLPTLFYLSGLTCTHANFMEKSGFQRLASDHRMIVVHPDTSPRGVDISGDSESWDFGKGAGFYVNATVEKWATNYNMYDYVVEELPALIQSIAPSDSKRLGIFGHSMGGHGALVIGLRNPEKFRSISAFAPISHPINCAWGTKAFTGYLGDDQTKWEQYDASLLLKSYSKKKVKILVDQGSADGFLEQLQPNSLVSTPTAEVTVRLQDGFDHSYYFIATFIADHFEHHAAVLAK